MKPSFKILSLLSIFLFSQVVFADCKLNGKVYKTGEKVAGYVCTASGRWLKDN